MNQNLLARTFASSAKKIIFALVLFNIQSKIFSQVQTQKAVTANVCKYIKGYYESLPVDYSKNPTKKYPLLIFLHGRDERGDGTTQIKRVLKNAIPKLINKGQFPSKFTVGGKDFSFIVISPQYSSTNDYATTVQSLVNHCKKKYRVDESRIYITGLSMGGLLSWNFTGLSKKNADQFAAMVTVCGGGVPTAARVSNIAAAKLPVWVTNNSGDPYNPASRAKQTVEALNAFKPAPPKAVLSVFQKAGHDAWTQSYSPTFKQGGLNVYEWMLSYTNNGTSQPPPAAPAPPVAKAGANLTITLPVNSVTLSGSGSTASSGSIKSYSWKKISGPTQGLLSTLLSITTKVTGLVVGVYKFELTVTDSNGKTAKSTVTVTVNPAATKPPTAKVGANQTITLPASSVTVNAGTSTAASGAKIKTYTWSKKSGPAAGKITSAGTAKTTITGLSIAGSYQFQIKVTDDKGKSATAVTTITVKPAAVPPTARAGANQTITLPTSSVTVNASTSKGANGAKIKTYTWSKKSGPSAGKITSVGSAKTTITGLSVAGTYQYQVKITDDKGKSATAVVTITVKAATAPAVANAGADKTVFLPERTVTLDGRKSTPSSGSSITNYAWSFVSGPKAPIFSSVSDNITTATYLIPGVYVFQLKVRDKAGKTATDKVTVNVKYTNGVLKANAGPDQTLTYPLSSDLALIIDGTASTVPSTGTVKASWKRISGPGKYGSAFNPSTHIVTRVSADLIIGTYQYQLTLKDNKGNTSTDVVMVKVKSAAVAETTPPTAEAGANQTITLPTSSVTINANASKASSGTSISSYKWTKKSGPVAGAIASATNAKTAVTGLVAGTYVFEVLVTDNNSKTDHDVVVITVNAAPAVANAGADKTVYLPERTVTLDGSKSTPSSGSSITNYAWSFVSGPKPPIFSNVSDNVTTATWLIPGVYVFQLKVRDKAGKTATDKVTVNVKYTKGVLKANAGPDQTLTYPLSSELAVIVDGTASTVPSSGTVRSSWKRISGPGSYGTTFIPSNHIVTRVSADLIVGTYQYQLTLKDDKGNTSTDVVTIKVKSGASARTQSLDASSQIAAATAGAISTNNADLEVKINPNPVTTSMNVWIDGTTTGKTSILVYNLNGSLVLQQSFTKDVSGLTNKSFNVANLATGTYFVKVVVNNTVMKSVQMIKQ